MTEATTLDVQENPAAGIVWDLSSYFPGFLDDQYLEFRDRQRDLWPELRSRAEDLGEITDANLPEWERLLVEVERGISELTHFGSYLSCLSAADARNERVSRELGMKAAIYSEYEKTETVLRQALREADEEAVGRLLSRPGLATARYPLERMRRLAQWSMPHDLEMLAADLGVDGLSAWGRLYDQIAGTLEFEMRWPDGRRETVPMAQKGRFFEHADGRVRTAALEGVNAAWAGVEESVAACLNHISGSRLTLNRRRGVPHFLDVALLDGALERRTLDAMWRAVADRRELPRRFLRLKARILGQDRLGFQDLQAPLPVEGSDRTIPWSEAAERLLGALGGYYPRLADFAREFLAKRFVEAEKRPGKRPGAFCTDSLRTGECRVFMTYGGTLNDILTLAHELGHAWHSETMRDLRPFVRDYPMTLAETASTFAEAILAGSLLADPATGEAEKLILLNQRLSDAATYLLNIHMRYVFEYRLYEERAEGEVGSSRLKELMCEAQRECYGEALREQELDPMFWASKLHFYITEVSFYNYPYTFGYLFSQALVVRARREGADFLPAYERLLRLTGSADCETVAREALGVDIGDPAFWGEAIDSLAPELEQFESLAGGLLAG